MIKMDPNNPHLTALVVGELTEAESKKWREAIAADPRLKRGYQEIKEVVGLLELDLSSGGSHSLGKERLSEIYQAGRQPDAGSMISRHRKVSTRQSFLVTVGAIAALILVFVSLSELRISRSSQIDETGMIGGEAKALASVDHHREPRGIQISQGGKSLAEVAPKGSLKTMIEDLLSPQSSLPEQKAFKVSEWIGLASFDHSAQLRVGDTEADAEMDVCPWRPDHQLLMVSVRSVGEVVTKLHAALQFDEQRVLQSALLNAREAYSSATLISGDLQGDFRWLYELKVVPESGVIGGVDFESQTAGQPLKKGYLPILIDPKSESEPSLEFSLVQTFCDFALWGRSEKRDLGQLERIAGNARELLTKVSDPKVRDALDAILVTEEKMSFKN